jgi:hypothetical protein
MDARWRIDLLGGLRAEGCDRVITRFRTQKTGGVLAYLAYYMERRHPISPPAVRASIRPCMCCAANWSRRVCRRVP